MGLPAEELGVRVEEAAGDAGKIEALLEEAVGEALRPRLRALADGLASGRPSHDVIAATVQLIESVTLALPGARTAAERLGPAYTTAQLRRLLPGADAPPVTDERVRQRRSAGGLVGLKTRDGVWVFPTWQFRLRPGRVEPRDDVLALWLDLPHGATFDEWSLALWLTGRRGDLDDRTPLAWLTEHGYDERLRRAVSRLRRRAAA